MLRKIMLAAFVVAFAGGAALAQETCESKAVGKDGKPLAGAAKAPLGGSKSLGAN